MSTGFHGGISNSAAGLYLAQTQGPELERAQHGAAEGDRRVDSQRRADEAAGVIGPDGEEHQPEDRSADGRRLWHDPIPGGSDDEQSPPRSTDATGMRGTLLDLHG